METWHIKVLGSGSQIYTRLRHLNELRHELCPLASAPFMLVIDVDSAQTLAFFPPQSTELPEAFGAQPSGRPLIDGVRLIDLEYDPLPVSDVSVEMFQPPASRPRFYM